MRVVVCLLLLISWIDGALACAIGEACAAGGGVYRVAPPDGWDGRSSLPTMIYFPGYRTSAADTLADVDIHGTASRLGVMLVALEPADGRWDLPPFGRPRRDEANYITAVLDEVERDYPVDRSRLMAAGFSIGASMLWYLGCDGPPALARRFTVFAAFSGTFWQPQPTACPNPPFSLLQLNGTADTVFPIHGRSLQNGRRQQGDSPMAVAMLRAHDSCPEMAHHQMTMKMATGDMPCETDENCADGTKVRMCVHTGRHEVEGFWIERAWTFLGEVIGDRSRPRTPPSILATGNPADE
jgi:polyhydroxybutyrate depolymerase